MKINGIDTDKLTHDSLVPNYPKMVPGRVAQIDGDFIAYMVSFDDSHGLDKMKEIAAKKVENIRLYSAAESVFIHLTHKDSDKGNRYNIAKLKPYQAKRDKVKPKYLHLIRDYLATTFPGENYKDIEADDGMSIAQWKDRNKSVIVTKDKDLLMVPGWHLNWDTCELKWHDDFGEIHLTDDSPKKLRGSGSKFFWAQMLMGDAVDNISGLPVYRNEELKLKKCGAVSAYNLLKDFTNDKQCFEMVKFLFKDLPEEHLVHHATQEPITSGDALISEAKLLWMRRQKDEDDVIHWMKEKCV